MRRVVRRGKKRRTKGLAGVLPRRDDAPLAVEALLPLSPSLGYASPESPLNQLIVTSDTFLAWAWRRHLFVDKRTAAFVSLEAAHYRLNDSNLISLIVDMESLTTSRFVALETLRGCRMAKSGLRIFLLISQQDPPMSRFLRAAGPFELLVRTLPVQALREAVLMPRVPETVTRFTALEWQLIGRLAQGQTLKNVARELHLPYHRAVYRITTLSQHLGLPGRQSLMQLLHRLTLDVNH